MLSRSFVVPAPAADQPVRDGEFETLAEQWRTMSRGQGVKKVIFLASIAAAAGYYLFLGILFLIG